MRTGSRDTDSVTVAITGPHGFIGSALMRKLAEIGDRTIGLVRHSTGVANEVVIGDLRTATLSPGALAGSDVVVHLAALAHELKKGSDPAEYYATNVRGTAAMLDAAIAANVPRFIYLSSIKAVGERTEPGKPFSSKSVCTPEDAYGASKLAAERLVKDRCDDAGIKWIIVRPPLVFGAGAKGNFALLIRLASLGIPLPLGAIRNRRSILYLENLVDALVLMCHAREIRSGVFTLVDYTVSTSELIRAIAASAGKQIPLLPVPVWMLRAAARLVGREGQIARLCESLEIDSEPSSKVLGWSPPYSLETALKRTTQSTQPPYNAR